MKTAPRNGRLVPALLALGACTTPSESPDPTPVTAPAEVVIAVLSTTDVHGHVNSRPKKDGAGQLVRMGGLALAGGYIDNLRKALDGRVLLLDGGDMWQGTMVSSHSKGEAVVAAMNALSYHAAAMGNHELDWGRDVMQERAKEQRFPLLAANVVVRATGKPPAWDNVRPWTTIELAGKRIGVVGLTTIDTPTYQRAGPRAGGPPPGPPAPAYFPGRGGAGRSGVQAAARRGPRVGATCTGHRRRRGRPAGTRGRGVQVCQGPAGPLQL